MSLDIIGDIHGHAEPLEALLGKLGYRERAGAWRHPSRTAIFVGDFIDRGPHQLRTLRIARRMVEAGSARAIMGNHEFNAIAWATPDPDRDGVHLRPRTGNVGAKNRSQHAAFLAEVGEDSAEHREWIDWFRSLPLWIEEPSLRVVHACWSPEHVNALRPLLSADNTMTPDGIVAASRKGSEAYEAAETLTKGTEIELPDGYGFPAKDGHQRTAIRTRWWDPDALTYRTTYLGPPTFEPPDLPLPITHRPSPPDRPTFIGHYWLNPREALRPLSPTVACIDYSVARGGPLVAYRYDGEPTLTAAGFVPSHRPAGK